MANLVTSEVINGRECIKRFQVIRRNGKKRLVHLPNHRVGRMRLGGRRVEIDRRMMPLIRAMNRLNIKTKYCCEGDDNPSDCAYVCIEARNMNVSIDARRNLVFLEWKRTPKQKVNHGYTMKNRRGEKMNCGYAR